MASGITAPAGPSDSQDPAGISAVIPHAARAFLPGPVHMSTICPKFSLFGTYSARQAPFFRKFIPLGAPGPARGPSPAGFSACIFFAIAKKDTASIPGALLNFYTSALTNFCASESIINSSWAYWCTKAEIKAWYANPILAAFCFIARISDGASRIDTICFFSLMIIGSRFAAAISASRSSLSVALNSPA